MENSDVSSDMHLKDASILLGINDSFHNQSNNGSDLEHQQDGDISAFLIYYILWSYVAPSIFGIIIIVGLIGNTLVIYVILSRPGMQTVTNLLLLNLAVSDIAFLVLCAPITAYRYAAATWPLGDIVCKLVSYIIYVTAYVTVYTLVAISALRYVTVIHNFSSAKYRTKKNVIILNILIWVAIMFANIPSFLIHTLKVYDENFTYCGMIPWSVRPFYITFFSFGYVLPLVIICIFYILVIRHLNEARGSTSMGQTRERTVRASKVIVLVVVIFMLSWLPQQANQVISAFTTVPSGPYYEMVRIFCNSMAYGNSCANPIIYSFVSQDFKRGFKEVMCCKKQSSCENHNGSARSKGQHTEKTAMI